MFVTQRPEIVFTQGEGSFLQDHTGKKYLDFVQGWAVNSLGHCHPAIIQAIESQAKRLINPSPAFYNEPMIELASLLTKHSCFDRVFFANSGAEANEGAIKLARKWGKKFKNNAFEIITFENAFHGRTLATMSAAGKPGWDTMFAPQVPGFLKAKVNDIESVRSLISSKTVAIMLEPIQGEGGVIPFNKDFVQSLRRLCDEVNCLLIVDEVQTGCGRTGTLFAYERFGIEPDIMTLGKGIGGGVPLAALLSKDSCAVFEAGEQGGTYCGNPLMTAVGVAVIETLLAPGMLDQIRANSDYLGQELDKLSNQLGLDGHRGEGMLRALLLGDRYNDVDLVRKSREINPVGLLINLPKPGVLRLMPSLLVSRSEIDLMIELLFGVLVN